MAKIDSDREVKQNISVATERCKILRKLVMWIGGAVIVHALEDVGY